MKLPHTQRGGGLEMETARRPAAFTEGAAHMTRKWDMGHARLARYRQGVVGARPSLERMRANGLVVDCAAVRKRRGGGRGVSQGGGRGEGGGGSQ
jgi:hypothetical protein